VLLTLYNNAKIQGMGIYLPIVEQMSIEDASDLLDVTDKYFDYIYGRVLKVDLSTDVLDTRLYDMDNGFGSCERILKENNLLKVG